ncbi:Lipoate-protein ligase A [Fimbriiglobus ruber]|uniref:Lipoate-protein ligase A n=2 Tax=Fimbriiglobus ruber TaxID=1908690 RepID=A0A225DCG0_9BACT|nr:Lipoate-protein ligase A [Fimbriiglobus ruber]
MAADEVLLLEAAETGRAALRFYGWAEPTLSLGYFQPAASRLDSPRLAGLPWVRRATGGAALVHHHEVTYALALPPGKPWQDGGEPWGCRFHHTIAAALARVGVVMRGVVCGEEKKLHPVLCFLHYTPGDLLAASAKVVGSAQRKHRGALLQHGGILLARSEHAPELAGLRELTGAALEAEEVGKLVAEQFAADTGWRLEPDVWTGDEEIRIASITADKYAATEWNEKR